MDVEDEIEIELAKIKFQTAISESQNNNAINISAIIGILTLSAAFFSISKVDSNFSFLIIFVIAIILFLKVSRSEAKDRKNVKNAAKELARTCNEILDKNKAHTKKKGK